MTFPTGSARRLLTGAATVPLAFAGLTLAMAAPASAAVCTYPAWSDVDGGSGYVTSNSTAIRVGPESICDPSDFVGTSVHLAYDCYVINSDNISWTHVHLSGSPNIDVGWVKDANLNDFGATTRCPK